NTVAQRIPELDQLPFRSVKQNRRSTGNPTPDGWIKFLDKTGISWTVLYPTAGLAVGRIMAEDWAVIACRAYNNWLYERFLNRSPRLKGVALIPFQNVDLGIAELRRAVGELGMLGGMLPSNGEAIQGHLGNEIYWRLYEEAEKQACPSTLAFSSYFPQLAFASEKCRHETYGLSGREVLSDDDKTAALCGTALRFYRPPL